MRAAVVPLPGHVQRLRAGQPGQRLPGLRSAPPAAGGEDHRTLQQGAAG